MRVDPEVIELLHQENHQTAYRTPHNVASRMAVRTGGQREENMDSSQLLARPDDVGVGYGARYLEGFATEMASAGYARLTIRGYLDSAIHFGKWAETGGLNFDQTTDESINAFGKTSLQVPWPPQPPTPVPTLRGTAWILHAVSTPTRGDSHDGGIKDRSSFASGRLSRVAPAASGAGVGDRRTPRSSDHKNAASARLRRWPVQRSHRKNGHPGADPRLPARIRKNNRRSAPNLFAISGPRQACAKPVLTMHFQPWRHGNFHPCPSTSTPVR